METKSDKLFDLVDWFNDFSDQLSSLFTRTSSILKKELKFSEVKRYAQYFAVLPWISDIFHMGLTRNTQYSIDIMVIFRREKFTHPAYRHVPSIIVAKIDKGKGNFINGYWALFDESNTTIKKNKDGIISGSFKKGDEKREFKAFQVDLEKFNTTKADEVIYSEILPQIKKIISK